MDASAWAAWIALGVSLTSLGLEGRRWQRERDELGRADVQARLELYNFDGRQERHRLVVRNYGPARADDVTCTVEPSAEVIGTIEVARLHRAQDHHVVLALSMADPWPERATISWTDKAGRRSEDCYLSLHHIGS